MALFVIGDLHLSLGADKPMDIFPGWEGYLPRLEANWRKLISPGDTVVLAGDTSWAMNLAAEGQPRLLVDHHPQDGQISGGFRLRYAAYPA